jgi:hypothetical protein
MKTERDGNMTSNPKFKPYKIVDNKKDPSMNNKKNKNKRDPTKNTNSQCESNKSIGPRDVGINKDFKPYKMKTNNKKDPTKINNKNNTDIMKKESCKNMTV